MQTALQAAAQVDSAVALAVTHDLPTTLPLNVYVAPGVLMRTVFEAIYTAGRSGYADAALIVREAGRDVAIPLASAPSPGANTHATIALSVRRDGYLLEITMPGSREAEFVQPGCARTGVTRATVPASAPNTLDAAALRRCLVTMRSTPAWQAALQGQRQINVAPAGDVTYQQMADTLMAVRGAAGEMFDQPLLGVLH